MVNDLSQLKIIKAVFNSNLKNKETGLILINLLIKVLKMILIHNFNKADLLEYRLSKNKQNKEKAHLK
jgi:hypothetical protein